MDFDALLRTHQNEVFSLCRTMVRDRQVAEDLAQDTLARAFAARGSFRGEASGRTWLLTIARNRCRDHLKRQHGNPFVDDPEVADEGPVDDAPLPARLLSNQHDVRLALEALPEAWRAMVVLRFVHGFNYDELATTFGIGSGAARMRVSRSLRQMRAALEPPVARSRRRMSRAAPAAPPPATAAAQEAPWMERMEQEAEISTMDEAPSMHTPPTFGDVLRGLVQ